MTENLNQKLIKAADFNPTKESTQLPIKELCSEIEKGNIVLPLFQTSVRWTTQKSIELLNFQLLGKAPVAPISMNKILDDKLAVTQVTFIDRKIVTDVKGKLSVNDGQQRLTCNFKAYSDNPDFRNIVLDLVKGKFYLEKEEIKDYQIPVGKLLNKNREEFFNYTNTNTFLKKGEVLDVLLQVRNKLFNYFYTINFAKDLNQDEQINWFQVLNLAGSKVPLVQMRFAKLLVRGIDIYSQYTDIFKNKLKAYGLEKLFPQKDTEVSIPIATLNPAYELVSQKEHSLNYSPIPSDRKESQLSNLSNDEIITCFTLTLNALDKTLKFINDNELKTPNKIDYITYLTGFFVYTSNKTLTSKEIDFLKNWYTTINFINIGNSQRREIFNNLLNLKS